MRCVRLVCYVYVRCLLDVDDIFDLEKKVLSITLRCSPKFTHAPRFRTHCSSCYDTAFFLPRCAEDVRELFFNTHDRGDDLDDDKHRANCRPTHTTCAHIMASEKEIGAPFTLASLPTAISARDGRTHAASVCSISGTKKRKRTEIAVGLDGEGVSIYSVGGASYT